MKTKVRPNPMSEAGMHAITNVNAEKVSDGLPNGVDNNDQENTQIDNVDFGLFNNEVHQQVNNLNKGLSVVKTAVDQLAVTFNQYGEMVKTVDERYRSGQDLELQIQELEQQYEFLDRKMQQVKQSHKVQLRNELKQHEKEISGLKEQAKSGQREKEKYEAMILDLKKEHESALKDARDDLETKKKQVEQENADRVAKLEAENKALEEKLTATEQQLEEKIKMHNEEKELRATMQSKADAEIQDLQKALASVKGKYEVQRLPVEHYAQRYTALVDSVAKLTHEYFSELPEEALDDPTYTYKQLRKKRSTFDPVPITQSECARVLRLGIVQNIIFNAIRETVWPPFFSRSLWKNKKDRSLIYDIYLRLASDGEEIQNDWKVSTLKVLDRMDNGVDVGDKIGLAIELHVVQILEPLLGERKTDFGNELKNIFARAMELSQEARRDRSPVCFDINPSADSGKGWKEFSEGFDIEEAPNPPPVVFREKPFEPVCVVPRLYRKRDPTASPDAAENELVYPGVALFPSTGIFKQGMMEWEGLVQAEREIRKAYNGKARRASAVSFPTGMGMGMSALTSLRPSTTWAGPPIAEFN
ncbi:hypothetical protein AYL99_10623 [Fonsecaea erecta]|uniref:Uncharacterized protein n=1 Tax=Fonsecaea erecta TaxID=1367422 RepID=A0A178Z6W6_9EURO|nr:hypothetical protein AYL99_10623 [Fonsecaea erecta]OAP54923.1 hypothetical protein AYL99_10623 [Fonsecaea erecta]